MHARIACGALAIGLAATTLACGPARDEGASADSAAVQAAPAVTPGAGATGAAVPAPPFSDTTGRGAGATSSSGTTATKPPTSRPAKPSTPSKDKSADTLEYDRAIDFKPGPGKELPTVDESKKRKP